MYLVKMTCLNCGRDTQFQNVTPPENRTCPVCFPLLTKPKKAKRA